MNRLAALLTIMLSLVGACKSKGKEAMRAEKQETIEQAEKEVGVTFPQGTKLVGVHRERGADDLIAVKVEMPAAAWPGFLASTPIDPSAFRPGERGLLGPDHDFWDPHQAKNLRTAETVLPGARVLNLGYADRPGAVVAVFVVNHGT